MNDSTIDRDWGLDLPAALTGPERDRLPTVANWVEEFKLVCQPRLAPSTYRAISHVLEQFALWIGTRKLSKELIVKFCEEQTARAVKAGTLVHQFNPVKQFLRWCHRMDYIKSELGFLVPVIRVAIPAPRRFSPEQYAALKEITKGTIWHYASIMAYRTGMRLSDVCLLKWENVNLEEMFIAYIPFKTRRKGISALCPIESGGDLHEVILDMSRNRSTHEIWSAYVCPEMAMYYPKDGGRLAFRTNGAGSGRTFAQCCHKIGARHLSFHKLRNSFMSRAVDANLNWMKVCQITGLRTFSVMMRYAKPDANVLRKDMEKLSQIEAEQAVAGEMKLIEQPVKPKQLGQ